MFLITGLSAGIYDPLPLKLTAQKNLAIKMKALYFTVHGLGEELGSPQGPHSGQKVTQKFV